MYSNQHNFALVEQRKAVKQTTEKSTKGDCESCGVKNIRNLERHFLTNSHIVKHDIFTTRKYIEDKYKKFKEDEALKNRAVNAERQEDDGGV